MTNSRKCPRQRDSQCRGPNVGPCLAGTSKKKSRVAGAEKVMKILVVADVKMHRGGQMAYNVETYGSSLVST